MGRIFFFHSIKNKTKAANMPKGSGLTKPMKLSADLADIVARRKHPEQNASNSYGHTSRRTTSKTQKTNNSSPPTKRWQRSLVMTASEPSVWPNFFHPTSQVKLSLYSSDL